MGSYTALVIEVDRITASPYPSQLRTLRDIADKCTESDIAQWAAAKPCLVEPLASCLLEGLQQWSYVLDVIAKFSFHPRCRDAFLKQEPTLLHSVVTHAIKPGYERSKYTRASVALLSLPLPDTVALPAEAQTLFIQLVEDAAKRPCPGTIQPVYLVLSGTGGLLLGVLSSEIMSRFEDHLLEILKNSSSTPDGCLSLYCLSIMNLVCASTDPEFRLTPRSYDTQDFLTSTPASTKWKSEAMQQFFSGSKAQRSIQLVVLSAYLAAKATATDCTPEKVKSLVLANEIIAATPADIRKIWCTSNPGMVRKLQERICAEDVEENIRTLSLRFVGKLCELDSLPHPVLEALELTFMEAAQVQSIHTLCPHIDDSELLSGVLVRAPINVLLENAVDYAIRADSAELAAGAEAVTCVVAQAQTVIATQKITGHQIREMLSDPTCTGKLQDLRSLLQAPKPHDREYSPGGWCHRALARTRSRLAHQISNLFLRASQGSNLGSHSMTVLLELHALSARGDHDCIHRRSHSRELFHFGASDGVETTDDHIDWREALNTHFKARAGVEQDAVTRLFARACADLEARCETIEKPLRDEQDKRKKIEAQHSAMSCAFDELESKYVDATLQVRKLEERQSVQADELQEHESRNARMLERVTKLEEQLHESQAEAQRQLGELKSAKQMAELDAAARLAQKQEALEDAEDETTQWKSKYKELAGKLSGFERGLEEAEAEREQLSERASKSESRVYELERAVGKADAEMDRLRHDNASLEQDLRSAGDAGADRLRELEQLRTDLQTCRTERDEVKSELTRETERLQDALLHLRTECEQLSNLARETEESFRQRLDDAQQEFREILDSKATEVASREAKIIDLKKRVERYQRKCQEKDQQIAEAESMRSNLMAAMGINKSQGRVSLPHRSRESVVPQTQTESQEESSTHSPMATAEGMDLSIADMEQSFISNADSQEDKNGPTPKRQKPRKSLSFAAPLNTTAKPRASIANGRLSRASTGVRQSMGRQPLSSTSGNRASLKSFKTPTKESVTEKHAFEDESTFEGSELFTGTQAGELINLQAAFDENS